MQPQENEQTNREQIQQSVEWLQNQKKKRNLSQTEQLELQLDLAYLNNTTEKNEKPTPAPKE